MHYNFSGTTKDMSGYSISRDPVCCSCAILCYAICCVLTDPILSLYKKNMTNSIMVQHVTMTQL